MRRLWLALVLACASCIQPALDTCGGLTCPPGKRCVVIGQARCERVADCDTLADGAACDPQTGQRGTCTQGVCLAIEECGNGIVESGEGCDCGAQGTVTRAECNDLNNSETDPLAPCRADCTLRHCGDGKVDALEQCDGAELSNQSCASLGFYRGTLACSNICTFTGCDGECGDGVLDPGELCEVGSPQVSYCVDYGFSAGTTGCRRCGPTFDTCRAPLVFTDLMPGVDNVKELVPGDGDRAWAMTPDRLYLFRLDVPVTNVPLPSTATDMSSHGTLVAVSTTDSHILLYRENAANQIELVTTVTSPMMCMQVVLVDDVAPKLLCLGATAAQWYQGTGWVGLAFPSRVAGEAIAMADGTVIFSSFIPGTVGFVYRVDDTGETPMDSGGNETNYVQTFDSIPGDGLYGGRMYGGMTASSWYWLLHLDPSSAWLPITDGTRGTSLVGGLRMWRNDNSEFTFGGTIRTGALDGTNTRCRRFLASGSEGLCLALSTDVADIETRRLLRFAGATIGQTITTSIAAGHVTEGFMDENGAVYAISDAGAFVGPTSAPPAGPQWSDLQGRSSRDILLFQKIGTHSYAWWNGATWLGGTPATLILAGTSDGAGNVVLAVEYGTNCSIIAGPAGGTLAMVRQNIPCPTALWASGSLILGATPTGIRDLRTNTLLLGGVASSIEGLDPQHLWAGVDDSLWYFDGASWTRQVQDPGASFNWISVASPDRIAATSIGTALFTWVRTASLGGWTKLRLPGDPSGLEHPSLQPWGVFFHRTSGTLAFSVWEDGWP